MSLNLLLIQQRHHLQGQGVVDGTEGTQTLEIFGGAEGFQSKLVSGNLSLGLEK